MYKFPSKQINFSDFNQPLGLTMTPNNRWIKKAEIIPWDQLEKEYADLFEGKNGQVAKPLRLALSALLIQIEYGYSDEETVLQIQENPYLQFFCGMSGYEDKPPFDSSIMVHFRKRLTPETIYKVNELVMSILELNLHKGFCALFSRFMIHCLHVMFFTDDHENLAFDQ